MLRTICFFLIACFALSASPLVERSLDPVALEELYDFLGVSGSEGWLRRPGQERWEIAERTEEESQFIVAWAERQGLFDAWVPSKREYDVALVLGATTGRMELRLGFLKKLWNQGVRFRSVVWLTGERPLDARVDTFWEGCRTESDAAVHIWNEAELPAEMRALPVEFVSLPRGLFTRPNTADTVIAWAATAKSGTFLFISNQPYCGYQYAVIDRVLPKEFLFDVAGEGTLFESAAKILDSVALWNLQTN